MPRPLARPLSRRAALALCPAAPPVRPRDAERRDTARRHARHALPRAERSVAPDGRDRRRTFSLCAKRAMKAATLRDCGRRCVYCAAALAYDTATLDHVYPRAKGGPDVAGNVVAACGPCNRMKADMLPTEFFYRHPWAGLNFVRYARTVHRALKRGARRAVSLACAASGEAALRAAA